MVSIVHCGCTDPCPILDWSYIWYKFYTCAFTINFLSSHYYNITASNLVHITQTQIKKCIYEYWIRIPHFNRTLNIITHRYISRKYCNIKQTTSFCQTLYTLLTLNSYDHSIIYISSSEISSKNRNSVIHNQLLNSC